MLTRVHQKPAEAYNRQPAITIQVKPISTEVVPSTPEPTDYYLRDYLKEHGVKGVNKRWSRETLLRKYKEIA
ncbi:MAG: Ish1 domain-containing protein [Cyanobacteria bacterium J06638_38]